MVSKVLKSTDSISQQNNKSTWSGKVCSINKSLNVHQFSQLLLTGGKDSMCLVFHCDQWPNWKEKPEAIFVPLTFLLQQSISSDQPPAAPISPICLNKVGSVTTELLPGRRKAVPVPLSTSCLIVPLGSEIFPLLCQEGPRAPSPHAHVAHKALTPGKTLPVSKLHLKGLWDTEQILREKSREGVLWAQVKLPYSYTMLIVLWRTRNCWFSSILASGWKF